MQLLTVWSISSFRVCFSWCCPSLNQTVYLYIGVKVFGDYCNFHFYGCEEVENNLAEYQQQKGTFFKLALVCSFWSSFLWRCCLGLHVEFQLEDFTRQRCEGRPFLSNVCTLDAKWICKDCWKFPHFQPQCTKPMSANMILLERSWLGHCSLKNISAHQSKFLLDVSPGSLLASSVSMLQFLRQPLWGRSC